MVYYVIIHIIETRGMGAFIILFAVRGKFITLIVKLLLLLLVIIINWIIIIMLVVLFTPIFSGIAHRAIEILLSYFYAVFVPNSFTYLFVS